MAATDKQGRQDSDHELSIVPAAASAPEARPEAVLAALEAAPEAAPARSRSKQVLSVTALFSALFIASLNSTLMANAVPTICKELDSAEGYAWIGAAYLLGNAASGPIWAKFSDIWGRKAILLCAVASFFFTSIICALSVNMTMLIAGRALQGVACGGLAQLVSIVISDLFSMRSRSLYIGLLEIIWVVAGGIGPVLGGTFAQYVSWRWNFWVILPPCAASFLLLYFALDVHNPRTGFREGFKAVDWAGSFCMLGLMVMLLLGLNFGGADYPWDSPTVICLIVFGALMTVFFVFSEKRLAAHPLLPLDIFAHKSNVAALVIAFTHDFGLFSVEYYLPFFFQSAKALPPVTSGVLMLPFAMTTSLSGLVSGFYIHRTGRYVELLWLGQALLLAGYGAFTHWDATTDLAQICGTQVLAGAGMGMLFAPPLISLQSSMPQSRTATATATAQLVRNVATVLSVVTGQAIFQNGMVARQPELAALDLTPQLHQAFAGNKAAASVGLIAGIQEVTTRLHVEQTFAWSMKGVWIMDACLIAVGFLSSAFITNRKLSEEHVETKTGLDVKTDPPAA